MYNSSYQSGYGNQNQPQNQFAGLNYSSNNTAGNSVNNSFGNTSNMMNGNHTHNNNNNNVNISNANVQPQLWMGDLDFNWDETYIKQLWISLLSPMGIMVHSIKLIRNSGNTINASNSGYCFIRFHSYDDATKVLNLFNGKQVPNTTNLKYFKLNWASSNQQQQHHHHQQQQQQQQQQHDSNSILNNVSYQMNSNSTNNSFNANNNSSQMEYSIFVGDIAPTVTEQALMQSFKERYPSVSNAKIMYDPSTGIPRGYGFVRFYNEIEQKRSLIEMQGFVINGRSIRVSTAVKPNMVSQGNNSNQGNSNFNNNNNNNNNNNSSAPNSSSSNSSFNHSSNQSNKFQTQPVQSTLPLQFYNDPTNTTIFIGNLNVDKINEFELFELFSKFGEINYVKIPNNTNNSIPNGSMRKVKNCGFIEFRHRKDAENALLEMQSFDIGDGYKLRISWGAKAAQRNLLNQLKVRYQNNEPTLGSSSASSSIPLGANTNGIPTPLNSDPNTSPSNSIIGLSNPNNNSLFYPTNMNQQLSSNDLLLLQSIGMQNQNPSQNQSQEQSSMMTNNLPAVNGLSNLNGSNINNASVNGNINGFAPSFISDESRLNDLLLAAKDGNLDNLDLKSGIYNV